MKTGSKKSDNNSTFLTFEAKRLEQAIHQPGIFLRAALAEWSEQCGNQKSDLQFLHQRFKDSGREWKFFLQIHGQNVLSHPEGSMRILPGSMGAFPVNTDTREEWQADEKGRYSHLFIGIFTGRLSSNFVKDNRIRSAVSLPFTQNELLRRMIQLASGNQPAAHHHCRAIADIILDGIQISGPEGPSRLIQNAMQLILDHPCNPDLSVKWMAQHLECHPDYLSRRFHLETGTSLMSYVRSKRMEIATDLLRSRQIPVAEVALSCGYRDHSYFTRIFHKTYGVVPSQWTDNLT